MHRIVLALTLLVVAASAAPAQDRIAYANLDYIVSKMPESRAVAKQLDTYQDELQKGLDTKRAYAQQKLTEARDAEAAGIVSDEKMQEYQTELARLDREIRITAADAEKKMVEKNSELMEPVLQRLYETIEAVAKREGYTHVLNTMDGTGRSIVMWGLSERDITDLILTDLGVPADEKDDEPPAKLEEGH